MMFQHTMVLTIRQTESDTHNQAFNQGKRISIKLTENESCELLPTHTIETLDTCRAQSSPKIPSYPVEWENIKPM
jgi:hypothetical protein